MKVVYAVVAAVLAVIIFMVFKNSSTPSGLGVFDGKLAPLPKSPNAVSSQTGEEAKKVEPFSFKGDLEESRERIKKALLEYGNIEIIKVESHYIHAVSTSEKMRFNDDLEFYFDEKNRIVHFRSASRIGYSDMGLNRKRYERLMELYR